MLIKAVTWNNILLSKRALGSKIDTKATRTMFYFDVYVLLKVQIVVLILIWKPFTSNLLFRTKDFVNYLIIINHFHVEPEKILFMKSIYLHLFIYSSFNGTASSRPRSVTTHAESESSQHESSQHPVQTAPTTSLWRHKWLTYITLTTPWHNSAKLFT